MAQETNTLETRNSTGGLSGAISSLFSGLGNLVTSTAPLAADVYSLKLQRDILKNQSAAELEKLRQEQDKLARAASTPGPSGMSLMPAGWPAWMPYAAGFALVLGLVLLLVRRR